MRRHGSQRGFTLIETAVGVAIALILGLFLLLAIRSFLHWSAHLAQRENESAAYDMLVDRWQAEADSAWAIFTPPSDVLGNANADGHEVDFFTRDSTQRAYFWAYRYDSKAQTLQRYLYNAPGKAAVADGDPVSGVLRFYAHTYPVTALQKQSSKIYSPLYANATLLPAAVQFGYADAPWIAGGNQITYVRIQGEANTRILQLSTQTAPSGFTVVLRYTPAPTATPKPMLESWPPAVRYAAQGTALPGCMPGEAQAFTDDTFTTHLKNGARDPFGAGVAIGPSGCYNGSIAVNETGYSGVLKDWTSQNACSNQEVVRGGWSNGQKSPATQVISGGSQTSTGCNLDFQDLRPTPLSAESAAQVIQPCWALGGSCSFSVTWPNDSPGCDPMGSSNSGYTGSGIVLVSPAAIGTISGGNPYTFTRAKPGAAILTERASYLAFTPSCSARGSFRTIGTITIPST